MSRHYPMQLKVCLEKDIRLILRRRANEVRLGERVQTLQQADASNLQQQLEASSAKFVLLGLPEDIGVRANFGRGGAYSTWHPVLHTLLHVQSNAFLSGEEILVLGQVDYTALMEAFRDADFSAAETLAEAREAVAQMDAFVAPIVQAVVAAGKELILVGGGHNNAYPAIKGAALAWKEKSTSGTVSCINCDAHTDLRPLEGRHSGNGFSYAYEEGFLNRYAMLGLHEMYLTERAYNAIHKSDRLMATYYEDIFIREKLSFREAIAQSIEFVKEDIVGLELDLDSIQNIPSSAKTSSGISPIQARQYVTEVAEKCDIAYFHLAEAAPVLSHIKTDLKTGKLLAYLITDYIKARKSRNQ